MLNLILPEELLDHEGNALYSQDSVTGLIQPVEVSSLATQRKEDSDLGISSHELVKVLNKRLQIYFFKHLKSLAKINALKVRSIN